MERNELATRLKPGRAGRSRGYTIIEVMVAVAILAIALPGLVAMIMGGRKTQVASLRMDQGFGVGQMILDSIQLQPARLAKDSTLNRVVGGTNFAITVAMSRLTTPAVDSSRLATVRVVWKQASTNHQVVVSGVVR